MESEKIVTAQTKRIASSPALTWIQREMPLRCAAAIGIEAPAMKPATQAVACSARTSELRQRIGSRSPGVGGSVRPGRWIGVMSGVSRPETNQTAASRVSAIATLSASQPPRTDQGRSFQSSKVSLVSRIPCENTCWLAALIRSYIGSGGCSFEDWP